VRLLTLFLCGDIMTGRGVDQALPHPCPPEIYETYLRDARDYVARAERVHGPIPRPVDFRYIWGDALAEMERLAPEARIVNLETAVTAGGEPWPGKSIHYRMHPHNLPCLTVAGIDCCTLANNHVLDWGYDALAETLASLEAAGVHRAGAGRDRQQAQAPAVLSLPGERRVLIFACGTSSSGIPPEWIAGAERPGVNLLPDLSARTAMRLAATMRNARQPGDVVVLSIHWGGNWGFAIPAVHRQFARLLIDESAVDVVHGHSSHHILGIEVYRNRPILYGCGDLISDYEGIGGYHTFRGDLGLLYFVTIDPLDGLVRLCLSPTHLRRFRLERAAGSEAGWLLETLNREGEKLGTRAELQLDGNLELHWK
jgi:poly-gamma-glutamate synthesis protein (capsule biosynthesis protein)